MKKTERKKKVPDVGPKIHMRMRESQNNHANLKTRVVGLTSNSNLLKAKEIKTVWYLYKDRSVQIKWTAQKHTHTL